MATGIKDVARAAGVSVGTVSNVLNRPDTVSPPLRARVEAAIVDLGFVRNEAARHLRAGSSRTIAVVVLDVANPFFTDVVAGAEQAAEAADALVVVCNSGSSPVREERHLLRLEEQRVMGVVISPVLDGVSSAADRLHHRGTPVVLVGRASREATVASVSVDDVAGGEIAAAHLIDRGHRDVLFIGGPLTLRQVSERLAGLSRAGSGALRVRVVESAGTSVRAGAQAAAQTFAAEDADRPTAIFCANDLLALGVLNECSRRGVRVPEDIAIIGYDDIAFAASASVPLTSIRQPREQLGRSAVELLLRGVGAASGAVLGGGVAEHVVFTPELVVRESTRRRP